MLNCAVKPKTPEATKALMTCTRTLQHKTGGAGNRTNNSMPGCQILYLPAIFCTWPYFIASPAPCLSQFKFNDIFFIFLVRNICVTISALESERKKLNNHAPNVFFLSQTLEIMKTELSTNISYASEKEPILHAS